MNPYEDIINLPYNGQPDAMPLANRAAQFAPFAALTGHDAAIAETARTTSARLEQSADRLRELSRRLAYAMLFADSPVLKITYFQPDNRKAGGSYVSVTGSIRKVEQCFNLLTLADNTEIPLDAITAIEGEIFNDLD